MNEMVASLPQVESGKVAVFIGEENNIPELKNNSVILSSYKAGKNLTGIIGVVGPMRMNYSKAVAGVDFFARQLETMLNERFGITSIEEDKGE